MRFIKRLDVRISAILIVAMFISSAYAIWLYANQSLIFIKRLDTQQLSQLAATNKGFSAQSFSDTEALVTGIAQMAEQPEYRNSGFHAVLLDSKYEIVKSFLPPNHLSELVREDVEPGLYAVTLSSRLARADVITIYQGVPGLQVAVGHENYLIVSVPVLERVPEPYTASTVWQQFFRHIGAFSVLFALMVGVAVYVVVRNFKPLRKLGNLAQELSDNKIPQQISRVDDSEIGRLVGAFNQASQKLASYQQQREQMTSDIAHELRTPVTNMQGRIEAYDEGIVKDEKSLIRFLSQQLTGLSNIVEDMQLLSSADAKALSIQMAPLNLRSYFQHWAQQYEPDQALTFDLKVESVEWELDSKRHTQIFDNLLANAKKAKPESLNIAITAWQQSSAVVIEFEDDGPGVDVQHLSLLFERLYRADVSRTQATGGSGLGLSIVKTLVEVQNGSVEAYINARGGLGIRITFNSRHAV